MRPLNWNKIKRRAKGGANGFFILFFIIWIPPTLKAALKSPDHSMNRDRERVYVQVVGDVESPGVYSFTREPGLPELIDRGGGLKNNSASPEVFYGVYLQSGLRIDIQKRGGRWRYFQKELSAFHKITLGMPLSLNRESEEGLTAIPGIGPGLAKEILKKRNELGRFNDIDEIKTVYGIGDKLFKKMKEYVTL